MELCLTFSQKICKRNSKQQFFHVLSHQAFCDSDIVHLLIVCLKTHCFMNVTDIVKLTDNTTKQSFCELLSSNTSHRLIKYIMEKENISFSQNEGRDILLGVCLNAASNVLEYINGRMKLEVNARHGSDNQTAIMLAAETGDSVFVNQIMSLDPDLNAGNKNRKSVFYCLCKNGHTSALKHAINMGLDVSKDHGSHILNMLP